MSAVKVNKLGIRPGLSRHHFRKVAERNLGVMMNEPLRSYDVGEDILTPPASLDPLPDLDDQLTAGDLLPLSDWLRDNLYALGRKLTPKETIERLTGSPVIDPSPYLAYLGDKVAALAT